MKRIPTPSGLISCLLLAGITTATATATAETALIDALGVLPGCTRSLASAISADGTTVVGGSSTNGFATTDIHVHPAGRAFVWHPPGGMTSLATLNKVNDHSWAEDLSADGTVIVGFTLDATGSQVPVRWDQGQPTPLPLPPLGTGAAVVISADGSTIVGWGGPASGPSQNLRWRQGRSEVLSPNLGANDYAISATGTEGVIITTSRASSLRWSDPIGVLPARISPTASDGLTHLPRAAAMTADGQRFFVSASGDSSLAPNGIFEWRGQNDGHPIPGYRAVAAYGYIRQLSASASGNLLAATAGGLGGVNAKDGLLVLPYGPLPFAPVLRAQGADTSHWSVLTNLTGLSADGRWVVGSGGTVAGNGGQIREEAFRAKLVLHAEGEPALRVTAITDAFNRTATELRWPAHDLLVAVESVPAFHPELPWQPEAGTPKIEGNEIVLQLTESVSGRYFRLRRLD
jgi:hypothetical protein